MCLVGVYRGTGCSPSCLPSARSIVDHSPKPKVSVGARVFFESKQDDSVTWALDLLHYEGLVPSAGSMWKESGNVFALYQVGRACCV